MYILTKPYQFTTSDSVIVTLDKGLKITETDGDNYIVLLKKKQYKIPRGIVEKNPDFFEKVDFKTQLIDFLKKQNKNSPYSKKADGILQFFEDTYVQDNELIPYDTAKKMLEACVEMYKKTNSEQWLQPISDLGWDIADDGSSLYKI